MLGPEILSDNSSLDQKKASIHSPEKPQKTPRHLEHLPEGRMWPDRLKEVAPQVMKDALQIPFLSWINDIEQQDESVEVGIRRMELIDGGTVQGTYRQNRLGRELIIESRDGFVDISDKSGLEVVDVRVSKKDGLISSTEEAPEIALDFIRNIDSQIIEPNLIEMEENVPVTVGQAS